MHPQYSPTFVARLWSKVDRTDSAACWLHPGCTNRSGHVFVRYMGKNLYAHIVAYELTHGPVPEGLLVCHNCPGGDQPACINPAHLWVGTPAKNSADMVQKGRSAKGLQHGMAKLSDEQVAEIRHRFVRSGPGGRPLGNCEALAEEFGVHGSHIRKLAYGTRR